MLKVWIQGNDFYDQNNMRWVLSTLYLNQPYVKVLKSKKDSWGKFEIKFQVSDYQFLSELMNHINNKRGPIYISKTRGRETKEPKYIQKEILKRFCLDHLQPIMKYGDADERLKRFEKIVETYSSTLKELEKEKLDF
jgi:hypothetical protein